MTDQRSHAPVAQPAATAEPAAGTPVRRRRGRLALAVALAAVVVAGGASVAAAYATRGHSALPRPAGIAADISDSQVSLMGLSSLPGGAAPDFTLTDQNGRTLSLSDLRGKVVVLEFMDPHCTDICPIVSAEFVDAYHDLGKLAPKVVFAAINVNQYYPSVASMLAFSREHQLTSIPDWHFFTGPVPALQATWNKFDIVVQAPNPNADIVHTSSVYFIDPSGHERYLGSPQVDHTSGGSAFLPADQVAAWGQGIAQVARTLLH